MDTSELLEQLRRRISETERDRDRLSEAVVALNEEVSRLASEESVVQRVIARFDQSAGASNAPSTPQPDETPLEPEEYQATETPRHQDFDAEWAGIDVRWPAGPGYSKRLKVKKIKAWARYKLTAADWYLDTLRQVASLSGRLDRVLGVEMAVDGVVQSLCATFDAAVYALTSAVESAVNIPDDRRTPVHLANWSKLAAEAKFLDIDLASSLSVSDALIGEHSETPQGWLAQLQMLRHRSARQDLLVARPGEDGSDELCIDVPSRGPQPPLEYLSGVRDLVDELLETILHDIADAKRGRLYAPGLENPHNKAVRDIGEILPSS